MRCDRQVLATVFISSVFAAPIGQSFFQPAQLRHKHEIEVSELVTKSPFSGTETTLEETETETVTQMYTEVETQAETVYVTEIYTQADDDIPESLPTSSITRTSSASEPKETRTLSPVALPTPPDEEFSSDNGKFLGLFLAVVGVVALLATIFFMLHRYRTLHKRTTTSKSPPSSSSDTTMGDSPDEYPGGEKLDRKQTSTTLLNDESDDRARVMVVGSSSALQQTPIERPSWLRGQLPVVALVGNGRTTESPRPLSVIEIPSSVFKRASSPSPLRNTWRARSGFHTPVIKSPRIPVTQSLSNIVDQEQYDVRCRQCEKVWLARPLSREWPKSP